MKSCENCGTKLSLGCNQYRAEDCGPELTEWTPIIESGETLPVSVSITMPLERESCATKTYPPLVQKLFKDISPGLLFTMIRVRTIH